MAGSQRRGGSPVSDGRRRCAGGKFFAGCTMYRERRHSHDPMRSTVHQSSSLRGCRTVQRPSVQMGRTLRSLRSLDASVMRPLVRGVDSRGSGNRMVGPRRLWRQSVRWSLSSSRSERTVSEPETVQTLSVWSATFSERIWSLNRRGAEKARGRQPIGSTWWWLILGESL